MLQTIREHTQGWIAGTIVTIIILTFALWGIHSYFVGGGPSSVVAEVNGTDISKEQLAVAYERLRRKMQTQYGSKPLTAKDEAAMKERALQSLIEIEALKQASFAQGYRISDRQIDNYLQSIPEFQVDGQFSMERFQEILSSTLLSTGEFLDIIKTSLLIDQPKLGVVFTSFALSDETNYVIELVNQERNIDYVLIPLQHFITQPIVIRPEKIEAYYTEHKNEFMTPEQVNVEYIELSLKDLSVNINPTESMLKNFYNENINSYTQPMEWKLTSVLVPVATNASQEEATIAYNKANELIALIKKGEKLPKGYTEDQTVQGWVTLSQVPTELQKAVAELTKPGDISEPIKTSKGFAIVKIVDVKETKIQPFESVQEKVKEVYIHQHAEEKFAELRDRLADLTYEHPDSLQYASKTLSLPVKMSELFTRDKAGKDISQYKKVRDTAFSSDVLNVQNNSDVIQLNPETVIVMRIKSHIASTLLPLKSISKQIEDKLKTEEAEARAAKFADDLKAQMQAGADVDKLVSTYKLTWNKAGYIGRYSTKVDTAILDQAFRMPNPAGAPNKVVYGITRLPSGYAIIALRAVKEGDVNDKKQYFVFAEQVQNSEGLLEYELYKRSQMDNAKIEVF